ncbi:MAG: NAD(+) diphosphatase [Stomatobaculum sp.]|nr:NAD(+) diphosphatase [Stomatobaculum sp.]
MIQDIAPMKFHNEYHPEIRPKAGDPVLHFRGRDILISTKEDGMPWPEFAMLKNEEQVVYGFSIDDIHYFLALDDAVDVPDYFEYRDVRKVRGENKLEQYQIFAAFTGVHLAGWYRDNRFCGSCGGKTEPDTVERAMRCKNCGRVIYPRINPAVIVGVTNGDKLLLTYYARNRGVQKIPALIAGFTEIGETFEECVAREVMEEVGMKVKNIRYYKSQPWGLADDILAGYYCDVDGDDTIHIDQNELKYAEWVSKKDITGQPNPGSMTHEMMIWFKDHEV